MIRTFSVLLVAAVLFTGTAAISRQQGTRQTIWSGVYTSAQASRGQELFQTHCAECHDGDLNPSNTASRLVGDRFMDRWREDSLANLFDFVSTSMPRNRPASLTKPVYLDVLSYLLSRNAVQGGPTELKEADVESIRFQRKDGPKPLPSGSLVQLIGCLAVDLQDETFTLTHASEPSRSRRVNDSPPEEIGAAAEKPLGELTFRLENWAYLGKAFNRLDHIGHRVMAKGTLIRQTNKERINLTYMRTLDTTCEP